MQPQIVPFIVGRLLRTVRDTLVTGGVVLAVAQSGGLAQAQTIAKPAVEAAPQAVPGFWDPRRRPDRPDLSRLTVVRFLTETDYPPFNFTGPDGNPVPGIAPAAKTVGKDGAHALNMFAKVVTVNLIGSFNMIRLAAEAMSWPQASRWSF